MRITSSTSSSAPQAPSALPPAPPPPPLPPSGGGLIQPGMLGLRLVDGVLLDFPLAVPVGARCWVATVWPDHRCASGWAAQAWPADPTGGRGWRWPARIAVGDVVEFGVDQRTGRRKVASTRWWGVIADYDGSWLLSVQGPHPSPAHAHEAAGALIQQRHQPAPSPPDPTPLSGPPPAAAAHRGRVRTHRH